MLNHTSNPDFVEETLDGIYGFLSKHLDIEGLVDAIRHIAMENKFM